MPMEWTSFTLKEEVPKSLQSPCISIAVSPQDSHNEGDKFLQAAKLHIVQTRMASSCCGPRRGCHACRHGPLPHCAAVKQACSGRPPLGVGSLLQAAPASSLPPPRHEQRRVTHTFVMLDSRPHHGGDKFLQTAQLAGWRRGKGGHAGGAQQRCGQRSLLARGRGQHPPACSLVLGPQQVGRPAGAGPFRDGGALQPGQVCCLLGHSWGATVAGRHLLQALTQQALAAALRGDQRGCWRDRCSCTGL